ncbi:hypothetical protein HK096_008164 [Nowakowskiella sp. JEL0078]|nr:hypothetical protein HK096_008164 [Nowakowskiella sp. JEL0078]
MQQHPQQSISPFPNLPQFTPLHHPMEQNTRPSINVMNNYKNYESIPAGVQLSRKRLRGEDGAGEISSQAQNQVVPAPQKDRSLKTGKANHTDADWDTDSSESRKDDVANDEMNLVISTFKEEIKGLKEATEDSFRRLCMMKEDEISIEEHLIENDILTGTHPEFVRMMEDIESRISVRRKEIDIKRRRTIHSFQQSFDAQVKLANDTLIDSRRKIRTKVINDVSSRRYQLMTEYESATNKHPLPLLSISPMLSKKRKQIRLLQSLASPYGVPAESPEWARLVVSKRNSRETKPNQIFLQTAVVPPPFCVSATEGEVDEDIGFIRLLTNAENVPLEENGNLSE